MQIESGRQASNWSEEDLSAAGPGCRRRARSETCGSRNRRRSHCCPSTWAQRPPVSMQAAGGCPTQERVLLMGLHHIVSDGWSLGVLVPRAGGDCYAAFQCRECPRIRCPNCAHSVRGFCVSGNACMAWTASVLRSGSSITGSQQASRDLATLDLPTDHPRPAIQTLQRRYGALSFDRCNDLQCPARWTLGEAFRGATPFMMLPGRVLRCPDAPLQRTGRHRDRYADREPQSFAGWKDLIGFFVNIAGDAPARPVR